MTVLPLYILTGLLFFVPPGSAASTDVKQMLEEFLSHGDLKEPPDAGTLGDRLDVLRSEPGAEVRRILPIGLSLLRSPNPNLQSVGNMTLIGICLRPDSAELLANLPELITLLEDHDRTVNGTALGILALLNPKPPTTVVPYLLPRLLDNKASTEKLVSLSGVLMRAAPDDPVVVGAILNVLQEHPEMKPDVLWLMREAHPVTERVLAFLGAGLVDPDLNVRLMAVQAVGQQSPEVIRHFKQQLHKISADTDEQSSTREFASIALQQISPR